MNLSHFLELEKQHRMFDLTLEGLAVWELARFESIRELDRKLNRSARRHPSRRDFRGVVKTVQLGLKNLIVRRPFGTGSHELMILGHPRRIRLGQEGFYDIYTDFLYDTTKLDVLHLEYSDFLAHKTPVRTPDLRYVDTIDLLGVIAAELPVWPSPIRNEVHERVRPFEEAIEHQFGVELDVTCRTIRELRRATVVVPLWTRLLESVDPTVVGVVVSYGRGVKQLIHACRLLNIPVVEIQHGAIYDEHPGYHYPSDVHVDLFPDYLLTFGEYWSTAANIPLSPDRIRPVGFPYLDHMREAVAAIEPTERILFISQADVGAELAKIALALADDDRVGAEVVYKLHPSEYDGWTDGYPALRASDVTVIADAGPDIYELFASATAQVGVYSTAMFEGLGFGLQTYIAQLPGSETFADIVEAGYAHAIEDADDIAQLYGRDRPTATVTHEFFRPHGIEHLTAEIEQLLDGAATPVQTSADPGRPQ